MSTEATHAIFAVAATNAWVHVYRDVKTLLAETDMGAGHEPTVTNTIEFFNASGKRLLPAFGRDWTLTDLTESGDPADPEAVHARITTVIEKTKAMIREHADDFREAGFDPEATIAQLPVTAGRSLADIADDLEPNFGALTDPPAVRSLVMMTQGSALHMLLCHSW
ncbi:hypothetical protein J2S43_004059 [Catenuloplanes nepalensis]|uniref:Uncharacterized protein n=1 Tax=Catenuloplanes nepalensis TaxID=587533 RepID=A0ABT9MVS2_9ACTN|nr:hypothetical protein [Catenuloplanes nepalensis]MDP9795547.1 hypothetical protein [Catenuloplanes nepalensis]